MSTKKVGSHSSSEKKKTKQKKKQKKQKKKVHDNEPIQFSEVVN